VPSRSHRAVWLRLGVVAAFAMAMAFLESATVVYLRTIFHITGDLVTFTPKHGSIWFSVPFFTLLRPDALAKVLPQASVARTEVAREAATIVMLLAIGWLSGRNLRTRAAYFFFAFGVWDIGYYAFLRLLIGWPASFKALDVLFLIPGPWLAPVFLPVLISAVMIAAAVLVVRRDA
jgi:hypothetical protein